MQAEIPVFPELRFQKNAPQRIVDPASVIPRDPEVIIGSWCGVKVNKEKIRSRPGWSGISAVKNGHIYEIKSTYILQPGPAALTEGVQQLHAIFAHLAEIEGMRVAVGTSLARRPPHRSVRAELPHTAPILDKAH